VRFVREFGLVVGGGLAMLIGFLLVLFIPAAGSSFGWTAYAPLTDVSLGPAVFWTGARIAGMVLVIAGVVALAADVAYRVGRGRRVVEASGSGE
jgi:heme/copper-type cytochrome/quinol oxidase subunit 1